MGPQIINMKFLLVVALAASACAEPEANDVEEAPAVSVEKREAEPAAEATAEAEADPEADPWSRSTYPKPIASSSNRANGCVCRRKRCDCCLCCPCDPNEFTYIDK